MKTTKNPIFLARTAIAAGKKALPDYSHPKSPHKFTQPQLFAMLILREFFKLDYRGLVTWLAEWSELREALELTRVPHYSTLKYAADRLLKKKRADALFDAIIALARKAGLLKNARTTVAVDSTGFESRHVSAHYARASWRHSGHYKRRFPKLSAALQRESPIGGGCPCAPATYPSVWPPRSWPSPRPSAA